MIASRWWYMDVHCKNSFNFAVGLEILKKGRKNGVSRITLIASWVVGGTHRLPFNVARWNCRCLKNKDEHCKR